MHARHPADTRRRQVATACVDALDAGRRRTLQPLLAEHGVVVMRGQERRRRGSCASCGASASWSSPWGRRRCRVPRPQRDQQRRAVTPPRSSFHTDTSYVRNPPAYTALRAVEVPESGWADAVHQPVRAYETLPDDPRRIWRGARSPTSSPASTSATTRRRRRCIRWSGLTRDRSPRAVPVARTVRGGERHVTENGADTRRVSLRALTRPDNVLRHAWAPGDVVIWDNRCVMHKADHTGVVGGA